ncbi:MAG: hypothetical protein CMD43_03080 [Gammaproteobacteria bacterium]|jgi:hypothetical protein|nr:hypothetical protein [Gammaproteobacteria bacterium]|tara:strand:- start:148 stop:873 length:726 start_codon:yes stop_codon:yes gene_type:complete
MPRKAKKGSTRYYFTDSTEQAVIRHNKETRPHMRQRIYNEHIRTPFEKLAENIIHTFKFYYFDVPSEDVKHEVVSFLYMNMHKFTEGKGKAFSYFSIVAKNYLILHNNNNYKKMKMHDGEEVTDYKRDPVRETDILDMKSAKKEYLDLFVEYWTNNLTTVFKRKQDIDVANAVIYLFETRENIENFNKKALYILIREMTGSNTQHITRVVNVMKKHHVNLQKNYLATGSVETRYTGSWNNL